MFLGYQNDKIAYVADSIETLASKSCVSFDRIEETDKEYFLHKGEYVFEVPEPTKEEQQQARQEAYKSEVDPLTNQIQRLRDELITEDVAAKIEDLLQIRAFKVAVIKKQYPYPTKE